MGALHATKYLLGICLLPMASVGWAQEAPRVAPAPGQPEAASPAAADGKGLEEIVVTANRRAELSQNVPIAINALTANALAQTGATGTTSLVATVPSLLVERQGNAALPYLRGIGSTSGDVNAESSVAIYIDGVYQPIAQANFFDFNDVERIEVLKGPQGTLFGRNATGGVIQVITKDPVYKPTMAVDLGYANYKTPSANVYASTGITNTLAMNVAVMYKDQMDGWGHNLTTGQDIFKEKDFSVRSKLLFEPDSRTKIVLAGDYYYMRDSAISGQPPFGLSGGPAGTNDPQYPAAIATGSGYPGPYNTLSNFIDGSTTRNRGVALHIEHDFGTVQFRSISAYRKFDGIWNLDQDLSPLNIVSVAINEKAKTFSQEVHLYAPSDAKFQWLVGSYYFRNDAAFAPIHLSSNFAFPPPFTDVYGYGRAIASSIAIFAQGTYPIADRLRLTLGGRYTWDRAHYDAQQTAALPGGGSIFFVPPNTGELVYSRPTWRAALDYKITPGVLAYVSYNRGSKSGNFSVAIPDAHSALYLPEKLDAYEAGLKSEFFGHRLRANLAAFYYAYQNLQFQKIVAGGSQTVTAKSAELYGAELDVTARATDNLTINGNVAYLHSRLGDFPNAPATTRTANGTDIDTLVPNGSGAAVPYNAEGNRAPNAPRFSGNVGFNYAMPTRVGNFDLSSNVYYTASYATEVDNRLWNRAHPLISAGLKWTDPSGALSLSVWGKNLSNEYYYVQLTGQSGGTDIASPAAPRTYGITLGYRYR